MQRAVGLDANPVLGGRRRTQDLSFGNFASKKQKIPGEHDGTSGGPLLRCQVPGCEAELSKLGDFNIRCRTCTEHSRAGFVVINDLKHRFCQQCNKYQPLDEFEGDKRGCRQKLATHNRRRVERRRKNMLQKSIATAMVSFGPDKAKNVAILKKLVAKMNKTGGVVEDAELEALVSECMPSVPAAPGPRSPGSSPEMKSAGSSGAASRSSGSQAALGQFSPSDSSPGVEALSCENMKPQRRLLVQQNVHGDVSSEPMQPQWSSDFNALATIPQTSPSDDIEGIWEDLQPQHNMYCGQLQPQGMSPALMELPEQPATAQQMFPDQMLDLRSSFLSQEADDVHLCIGPGCSNCFKQQAFRMACQSTGTAQPQQQEGVWQQANRMSSEHFDYGDFMQQGYLPDCSDAFQPSPVINALPQRHVARVSMKIDGATPSSLPQDLMCRFSNVFEGFQDFSAGSDMMGYIRPGCVHLTVDVPIKPDASIDNDLVQQRAVQELLGSTLDWSSHKVVMTLPGGHVNYSPETGPVTAVPSGLVPELVMVQLATADGNVKLTVRGLKKHENHQLAFLCRLEGRYWPTTVIDIHPVSNDLHCVTLKVECGESHGVAWIEIVNDELGSFFLSAALPVLISDNAEVCTEVCRLLHGAHLLTSSQALAVLKDVEEVLCAEERGSWNFETCSRLAKVAARCGWAHTVQECIELATLEVDMGELLALWPNLLLHSVQSGDVGTVAQVASCYVTSGIPLPLAIYDALGFTALHWAALGGEANIIRLLRGFDAEDRWHSCSALREPHLTPAAILEDPTTSMPHSLRKCVSSSPIQQRAEPQDKDSLQATRKPRFVTSMVFSTLFFPVIFLVSVLASRPVREWPVAFVLAALGGGAEYAARFGLPALQAAMLKALISRHPELEGRFLGFNRAPSAGGFGFQDPTLDAQYLSYWYRSVVLLDPTILGVGLFKLGAFSRSANEEMSWVFNWVVPAVALALWRMVRHQPPAQQELYNLAFDAYSWLLFWVTSVLQLPDNSTGSTSEELSLYACISSCVIVIILSLQHAIVYPVRMQRRWQAATFGCVGALVGLQLRSMLSPACTSGTFMRCTSHSMASAVLPTLCGFLATEVVCTILENTRLQGFFGTTKKAI